jgi:hypothetical protein
MIEKWGERFILLHDFMDSGSHLIAGKWGASMQSCIRYLRFCLVSLHALIAFIIFMNSKSCDAECCPRPLNYINIGVLLIVDQTERQHRTIRSL